MTKKRDERPKGTTLRVLVVDDHSLVRHGLRTMLQAEPDLEVCGEATDGPEALSQAAKLRPDLVLLDLSLPQGHGLDVIKQIKARDPHIQVLVVSMHDEALYAERALRAGASGYINKGEAIAKVVEGIRHVLAGKIYLSPAMTERLLRRSASPGEPPGPDPGECLSDRELMVFELIGEGLSTRAIAEKLYLSVKTIETYKEHIKAKLNLENSSQLGREATRWVLEKNR